MFEKGIGKKGKGKCCFYWAPARLFHSAVLMQKSELTRKFSDFKTIKRMFSLHQVVWQWSQQMLTDPHKEMLESGLVQIYINIRYPTKNKGAFFCKIRFDHPSARSGFHGEPGGVNLPCLSCEMRSVMHRSLSFIPLNFWTLYRSSGDTNLINR